MKSRVPSAIPEGLLFALTAFGPLAFGSVEPWARATLEVLAFSLALACWIRGRPAVSPEADTLWLFPAGFAALGLVQLLAAAAPDGPRPFGPFTAAPYPTQGAVLLWGAYAAVLWSVPRVITTHEAARRYTRCLFGLGIFLAVEGMLQQATSDGKLYWLRAAPRAYSFGPYYNRDHAANLLLLCLGAGLGVFFSRAAKRPGADGLPRESGLGRAARGGAVLLVLAGVLACGSRGALLALPLAGAALALFGAGFAKKVEDRRRRAATALAGGALVVALAFQIVGAAANAGGRVEDSVTARLFIYADSLRMIGDAPLFGTGLGSFETMYPAYQDQALRGIVRHAHSDWLELALESGLLGLLAALLGVALTLRAGVRAWHSARSSEMRALIGGGLAAVLAFAVHSLFEFGFQIPGNAAVMFGVTGFLLSAPAWADKSTVAARLVPPSPWSLPAAVAGFLVLAWAAVSGAVGLSGEADPHKLTADAAYLYIGSDQSGQVDMEAVRGALVDSLAAVARRPFDAEPLSLAGAALRRLGRSEDARVFFERARVVRFRKIAGSTTSKIVPASSLEALRAAGLAAPVRGKAQ